MAGETKNSWFSEFQGEPAYQKNLSQPVQQNKWYQGDYPTTREVYGQIGRIYQQDRNQAVQYLNSFRVLQATPGSRYFNPYKPGGRVHSAVRNRHQQHG